MAELSSDDGQVVLEVGEPETKLNKYVGGIHADQLRSLIERIERLEEDKQQIADDIKEVFAEAKAHGYDVPTLRKVLAIRKQEPQERSEQEMLLHTYMLALGMDVGE